MVSFQRKLEIQCQREEICHLFQCQKSNHQIAKWHRPSEEECACSRWNQLPNVKSMALQSFTKNIFKAPKNIWTTSRVPVKPPVTPSPVISRHWTNDFAADIGRVLEKFSQNGDLRWADTGLLKMLRRTVQASIRWWRDNQNVVYSGSGVWFDVRKQWSVGMLSAISDEMKMRNMGWVKGGPTEDAHHTYTWTSVSGDSKISGDWRVKDPRKGGISVIGCSFSFRQRKHSGTT